MFMLGETLEVITRTEGGDTLRLPINARQRLEAEQRGEQGNYKFPYQVRSSSMI